MLLAFGSVPQHELAFRTGQTGEESVARSLERRTENVTILHDRQMPRGYGNIDHLAIAPTGVWVIDAKNIGGKVRISRPLRGDAKLMINKRNRSRLLDGLDRQVDAVRQAMAKSDYAEVPLHGVLCFTKAADFPLIGAMELRGHRLHHVAALRRKLKRAGPLSDDAIQALARDLARAFPPA